MRRIIKGTEEIILREYPDGGFTSIEVKKLTMKMKEIHTEESLVKSEVDMPVGFREMSLIDVIKSDIANKDNMGWEQHQQVLKEDGFDV